MIGHSDQIASTIVSRAIQPSSASVRSASPTIAIASAQQADADRPRERGLAELAPLVAGALATALGRLPRRRPAGEAVGEPLVGPADHARPEGDGHADVGGREAVASGRGGAAREVDRGRDQQHEVDQRDHRQQDDAEGLAAQQVPRRQTRRQDRPEGDLGGGDQDRHRGSVRRPCFGWSFFRCGRTILRRLRHRAVHRRSAAGRVSLHGDLPLEHGLKSDTRSHAAVGGAVAGLARERSLHDALEARGAQTRPQCGHPHLLGNSQRPFRDGCTGAGEVDCHENHTRLQLPLPGDGRAVGRDRRRCARRRRHLRPR